MHNLLKKIIQGENLNRSEACNIIHHIVRNEYNDILISSLLTSMAMRGVNIEEILGFRDGLLETGKQINIENNNFIDIVGTGGDNKNTFNISTCACLIVAGAGYKVVKHGNYASTSVSGASNVIEAHGVKFSSEKESMMRNLDKCNFTYLHAPLFANGFKKVANIRKTLGFPTIFNLLGPLINPCTPKFQILGVANLYQMRLYNNIYEKTDIVYGIVNSMDGYDEISLTGNFKVKTKFMEKIYSPHDLGLDLCKKDEISGGTTSYEAKKIFDNILDNNSSKNQKNVALANAAFAIHIMENNKDINECFEIAKYSLESGNAKRILKKYIELNS